MPFFSFVCLNFSYSWSVLFILWIQMQQFLFYSHPIFVFELFVDISFILFRFMFMTMSVNFGIFSLHLILPSGFIFVYLFDFWESFFCLFHYMKNFNMCSILTLFSVCDSDCDIWWPQYRMHFRCFFFVVVSVIVIVILVAVVVVNHDCHTATARIWATTCDHVTFDVMMAFI